MNKIFKSKKVLLLIIILTISSFFIVSFTVLMLYNTSMDMKENSLIDVVEGQKAIINTLLDYSFGEDEIISVLQKSLGRYQSIGKTGELVVAKKSGDSIIFIYRQKFSGKESYQPVLLDSNIASPMRKALKGKSGLIRGLDYKGVEVIAGYTYIKKLNWGIVAKINISEVNKPFYKVAIIAAILAFLLVTFGTYFIIKSTNPMMNRIIQSEQKFKSLFDNSADAIFILDIEGKILEANNTACKRLGYEHDELINLSTRNINSEEYAKTLSNRIKLITENASLFCETEHVGKDGTIFPIELNASLIDFNNQKAILSIARDITERKLAEARLKENELLLRTIAENYPNSYLSIIEKDYTIGFTSGQELKKLNLAPETFVGLNLEEVFGEHSPTVKKYYEKTFEGEEIKFELFFNNQNQLYRTVPLRNEKGEIERILSVVENITERKREEEKNKLKAQEQEWLLNSMMNAFVIFQSVFDENGKFISYRFEYINKAYEDITGVKLEEVVGRTVHEVWPKTEQSWIENYGAVAVTGIERTFDMFHAPTDKLYHCNVYRPWKTSERFCVIFEDITERKQAEQALKENEEKFRTLFDLSPFGIILHKDGIVLSANQAAAKIFGAKSPGELVGYELLKLVDEEYHEIIKKRMDEIIRTNIEAPLLEEKLRRLDGTVFDAECVARQITIEGQSFIQVMF
ncbi:MAG: hypothetical protein QG635_1539, partial [Bacteroidota bacterium]|nr:hypothetical protein [Bacteroidota bacterium]